MMSSLIFNLKNKALIVVGAIMLLAPSHAMAQGLVSSVSGLAADPDAPIEIEADQLDIFDKKKIAIFKGNVHAKQGDTTLLTSSLTIHYTGGDGQTQGTTQSITSLDADGNVVVIQKDQKATGDSAHVDMQTEKITLSGNVVLTQGENVLRGSKLYIDMPTGEAQLVANQGASSGPKGRVQGLFTSNRKPKN